MKFATRTQKTGHSGLEDLFAASGPNVISFAGGYPDRGRKLEIKGEILGII